MGKYEVSAKQVLSDKWRVFLTDAQSGDEVVVGPALSRFEIAVAEKWLRQDGLLDVLFACQPEQKGQ